MGGRKINLGGGRRLTITIGLDPRGRKLLKAAHSLRVRMAITQGKRSVLDRKFTLRQPPAKHKRKHKKPKGHHT